MERRLAAILVADLVGYTRLVASDEAGTVRRLRALREEVIEPLIATRRGRVVKLLGDGLLVEFASIVDAVDCAVAWQRKLSEFDWRGAPPLVFRIGVNLGDVIAEGGDLLGDGVNIAARLEPLAEPGGICVSEDAYRHARGKIDSAFVDLGPKALKNVPEPVRVFRVSMGSDDAHASPTEPNALDAPAKPSIAVLPFANMSSDEDQEYFADGVTDDIITNLCQFHDLFVIARNSSFTYKGRAVRVRQAAEELGVKYVLEGGVRAAGQRIRINAQLIDAENEHHIWAERYDGDLADVFDLQDEISQQVAAAVVGRLRLSAQTGVRRKTPGSLQAYDYLLQGRGIVGDTRENNERAKQAYAKAIDLDPDCARAYSGLSQHHVIDEFSGWGESVERSRELALQYAVKAAELDPYDSEVQWRAGYVFTCRGEFEEAKRHLDQALELNSNDADALTVMGMYLTAVGEGERAVDLCNQAIRLNPFCPGYYIWNLGTACYCARRYGDAAEAMKKYLVRFPKFVRARRVLAASYARLGRLEEAEREIAQVAAADPTFSLARLAESDTLLWKNPEDEAHWLEGLRLAGAPE